MLDYVAPYFPIYQGEYILAALFGGLGIGVGLAIIFMRGSTTGGTDIICKLLQKWFPHIQLGKIVIAVDVVVVALAALVFEQVDSAMYAMISAALSVFFGGGWLDGLAAALSGTVLFITLRASASLKLNSIIQTIKNRARGYRDWTNLRTMYYLKGSGLC